MTKPELNGLSEAELELLSEFLSHTQETGMETVAQILTTREFGTENSFGAGLADVLHYISDSVTTTDRQVLRLDDMRKSLEQITATSPSDGNIPEEAKITPEKLHWLTIRSELTSYYSQAGVLLEEFSTELILEEVIDGERRSNRVERDIENKSQWEREWLLFVTGVIDSGEKEIIRDTYRKRNDLVHNSATSDEIDEVEELKSEISRAWDSVDLLHEKLFGLEMRHRISEIVLGNEF